LLKDSKNLAKIKISYVNKIMYVIEMHDR